MSDFPLWVVEGFQRQERLQATIQRALETHLPPPRTGQLANDDEAILLIAQNVGPEGGYRVTRRAAEMERLARFQEALEAAATAWAALSHSTRSSLNLASRRVAPGAIRGFWSPDPLPSIAVVAALPDMMRGAQRSAMQEIERSAEAGDIGWRAVSIVGDCRNLWSKRTGRRAPMTTKPALRFHDFLEAILDAFDAGRPVPAMRRWKKLHSEGHITE